MRKSKIQAQATIEFSLALILAVLFLFLSCNLFVWLNRNIVQRQVAYENTRVVAGDGRDQTILWGLITTKEAEPGKLDFYITNSKDPNCTDPNNCKPNANYKPLNVFVAGGYNK